MAEGPDLNEMLSDISIPSCSPEAIGGFPASEGVMPRKDLFALNDRKAWKSETPEARCDFTFKPRITRRADIWFISVWQKSLVGRTLTDIKGDDAMIPRFAQEVGRLIGEVLGGNLQEGGYALVTSPKRRHKEHNFATLISIEMAKMLGIPFYEDAAFCHSRHRMNAVFEPNNIPREKNVIVFDDFVTSGNTMRSMADLLLQYDKNLTFFTGINNKL